MCFFSSVCVFSLQSSFIGAIAIGDLVKSTLGPKGMVGHVDHHETFFTLIFWCLSARHDEQFSQQEVEMLCCHPET